MPLNVDPEIYSAGVAAILAEYPVEILKKIADPVSGSRYLDKYPSIPEIRRACEEIYAPMRREEERLDKSRLLPAFVPHKRSPEEQARVDAHVASVRHAVGISR